MAFDPAGLLLAFPFVAVAIAGWVFRRPWVELDDRIRNKQRTAAEKQRMEKFVAIPCVFVGIWTLFLFCFWAPSR